MNETLHIRFAKTGKALFQLQAVLERSADDDVIIDATIQRFEFTLELFWKLLRSILLHEGINELEYPKKIFIKAYSAGFINDEKMWLNMLSDRNETSHTYDEEQAILIYTHIKNYYPIIQVSYDRLLKKYSKN